MPGFFGFVQDQQEQISSRLLRQMGTASNRLGLLLSFELWHRQFIDESFDFQDLQTARPGGSTGLERELEGHVSGEGSYGN
jgi:hypothetical protein